MTADVCVHCNGKGKVPYYHGDEDTCPTCHGSGRKLCLDCPPSGYPADKTRCSACPLREFTNEAERTEYISALVNGLENLTK